MIALFLAAGAAGGCVSIDGPPDQRAGLSCVDDSPECISRRQATLGALVADKDRKWVHETATPEAYASGVRLMALKSKRYELSCDELARGRKEADGAGAVLRGAGNRLTPAQISRGTMLAAEVSRELRAELSRRCKRT